MRVAFQTFGCKANQYDSERMRQELEAAGCRTAAGPDGADAVVVNTCTVTRRADAEARRQVRKLQRDHPGLRVVVVGCSAALHAPSFRREVAADQVVEGHDPQRVARAVLGAQAAPTPLVQIGGGFLRRREAGTRGWLKVQDGCDRQCSFCATRLARGSSRSRPVADVLSEAGLLAAVHPEIVLTGIHIGHYGLGEGSSLGDLVAQLTRELPGVRFRLGSVEATEIDEALLDLFSSAPNLAPHLHMPLQSGADPVLRRMRRWHTRAMYRDRALKIAESLPVLGLGADIITGFPGETDEDHAQTVALVEELPFTYLHVFPFSPREGTPAAELAREMPVPQRVAAERAREIRELGQARGEAYLASRVGAEVEVVVERPGTDGVPLGLTGDYLRLPVKGAWGSGDHRIRPGTIEREGDQLFVKMVSE
ncbi:MAG: MiaB/RimO family radical SAM methylthiotransferase [Gemmatimonadales bacterium]|nr:MAG: MiaB/RimO family radical SAM methylthiotransferase [Gemmatimonadales bacterium]